LRRGADSHHAHVRGMDRPRGQSPPVQVAHRRSQAVLAVSRRSSSRSVRARLRRQRRLAMGAWSVGTPGRPKYRAMEHSVVKLRVSPARHERRPARRPLPPPPEPCDRRPGPDVAEAQLPEAACTCQDLHRARALPLPDEDGPFRQQSRGVRTEKRFAGRLAGQPLQEHTEGHLDLPADAWPHS